MIPSVKYELNVPYSIRKVVAEKLIDHVRKNPDARVIDVDLAHSEKTTYFLEHPEEFEGQYFNLGPRERSAIGIAMGFATEGKNPFVATFSKLSSLADDIIDQIAYSCLPVNFLLSHYGIEVGKDGSSHHDITYLARFGSKPNTVIMCPADALEAEQMFDRIVELDGYCNINGEKHHGPVFLLSSRNKMPAIHDDHYRFEVGQWEILDEGEDIAILSFGATLHEARKAYEMLSVEGIYPSIINTSTLKPLDIGMLKDVAGKSRAVVTVASHSRNNGFGDTISSALDEAGYSGKRIKIEVDKYPGSDDWRVLFRETGIDSESIYRKVMEAL